MSSNVILGLKLVPNEYKCITIGNVNLENNVSILREHASKNADRSKESIDLVFAGHLLEDNCSISSYGIKSGFTVHVLERNLAQTKDTIEIPTNEQINEVLRYWMLDYSNRTSLQKLYCSQVIKRIVASHTELQQDPPSLAYLQDLELLFSLTDEDVFHKVIQAHPVIFPALSELTTELLKDPAANQATTSTGYSYSLEALSDEDDDEEAQSSHPLARNASFNAITAAQLAAALENAQTNFSSTGQVINNARSSTRGGGSLITSEMFGNALQQAFVASSSSSVAGQSNSASVGGGGGEETLLNIRTRLMPQLRQMQEMGLVNEAQNLRALQATNGDVQAAIELVFNGVID